MSDQPERDDRPLADRREDPEQAAEPDFADEHSPSPTDPASQPEQDPDKRVYGQDEGYNRPTRV
jgi:hypothetical protein